VPKQSHRTNPADRTVRTHCRLFLVLLMLACPYAAHAQPGEMPFPRQLSHADPAVREQAIAAAARQEPEVIIPVAPLLDHADGKVRAAAALALAAITEAAAGQEDTRERASRALRVAAISVRDKGTLLRLLAKVGDAEAIDALFPLLDRAHEHAQEILHTLVHLAQERNEDGEVMPLDNPELAERLLERLEDADAATQVAIISALGQLRATAAGPVLLRHVQSEDELGAAAREALGQIGTEAAAQPLLAFFQRTGESAALEALLGVAARMPDRSAQGLYLSLLQAAPPGGQEDGEDAEDATAHTAILGALRGLERMGSGMRVFRAVLPLLDSEAPEIRAAVCDALARMPGNDITRRAAGALRRASPKAKAALLEVLHARDPATAERHLRAALEDEDPGVQAIAMRLLESREENQEDEER